MTAGEGEPRRLSAAIRRGTSRALPAAALLAALLPGCGPNSPTGSEDPGDEARRLRLKIVELKAAERALAAEYALARNSDTYLRVDLDDETVELRARGRTLRSFPVREVRRPGTGNSENAVWTVQDRKPLRETQRPKIEPGAGEQAAVDAAKQELWGPHRMPSDYDLLCEENKILEIRALPPEESRFPPFRWLRTWYRRSADRYRHWQSEEYRNRYLLQLWLVEEDSQLLFWALPKQLKILVHEGPRQLQ